MDDRTARMGVSQILGKQSQKGGEEKEAKKRNENLTQLRSVFQGGKKGSSEKGWDFWFHGFGAPTGGLWMGSARP